MQQHSLFETGFATDALEFRPFWRVRFSGPLQDIDRIFDEIIKIVPLTYGKTDRNASRSAPGYEYYRPMEGTPTGSEDDTRKRPDIVDMSICLAPEESTLRAVVDTIYQFHSYYEPPISIEPILRSSTLGLDDSDNPHRWWNNQGDWKTAD